MQAGGRPDSSVITPANFQQLTTLAWTCIHESQAIALSNVVQQFHGGLEVTVRLEDSCILRPAPRLALKKLEIDWTHSVQQGAFWRHHDIHELRVTIDKPGADQFASLFAGIKVLDVCVMYRVPLNLDYTALPDLERAMVSTCKHCAYNTQGWHITVSPLRVIHRFDRHNMLEQRLPARRNRFAGHFDV